VFATAYLTSDLNFYAEILLGAVKWKKKFFSSYCHALSICSWASILSSHVNIFFCTYKLVLKSYLELNLSHSSYFFFIIFNSFLLRWHWCKNIYEWLIEIKKTLQFFHNFWSAESHLMWWHFDVSINLMHFRAFSRCL